MSKHKTAAETAEESAAESHGDVKVGDKVKVDGQTGEVTEVHGDFCSVRLEGWEPVVVGKHEGGDDAGKDVIRYKHPKTDEVRDHQHDVLGGVHKDRLKKAK